MHSISVNEKARRLKDSTQLNTFSCPRKVQIIYRLPGKSRRFGVLERKIVSITRHILMTQLRELERDGFIYKEVYVEVPARVEYSLTTIGQGLEPVLQTVLCWGEAYIQQRTEDSK